jgi:hypothetical protein
MRLLTELRLSHSILGDFRLGITTSSSRTAS